MKWFKRSGILLAAVALTLSGAAAPAWADDTPPKAKISKEAATVITFTFDDGWKGQEQAAAILDGYKFPGTFYINSGQVGFPDYMTYDTLQLLTSHGHEIGGHTVSHPHLTQIPKAQARAEICNDRATLLRAGFRVTDFAYPHGDYNTAIKKMVRDCGYVSARSTSGLRHENDCTDCPWGNSIPPRDPLRIRTGSTITKVDLLKRQIEQVEKNGGGWVPLVFHHICDCPEKGEEHISLTDFSDLVVWIAQRPKTTRVYSVEQVIGGNSKPAVGTASVLRGSGPEVALPGTSSGSGEGALVDRPAFTVMGIGIGLKTVIVWGIGLSTALVVLYRVLTRGQRYAGAK